MNVTLRKMTLDDCPMVYNWRIQPEIDRFMINNYPKTIASHLNWFNTSMADETKRLNVIMVDKRPVGVFSLFNIDWVNSSAYFGIYIGDLPYQGLGIAKDLLKQDLGFKTLKCEVFEENGKARRLYERVGFKVTGSHMITKNGREHKMLEMERKNET